LLKVVQRLPAGFPYPVVIVLHRQRNVSSDMQRLLGNVQPGIKIIEPDDKEMIQPGFVYLAPQNYHLLIEPDKTLSLDYSEVVKYSRPSIDVTFESAALVYKQNVIGILLSGANNDGASGLLAISEAGGTAIVQDPASAEYHIMPQAAIDINKAVKILNAEEICNFLEQLPQ